MIRLPPHQQTNLDKRMQRAGTEPAMKRLKEETVADACPAPAAPAVKPGVIDGFDQAFIPGARPEDGLFPPTFIPRPVPGVRPDNGQIPQVFIPGARPEDGLFPPTFIPRPVPGARPDDGQIPQVFIPGARPEDGLFPPTFIPRPVPGSNDND